MGYDVSIPAHAPRHSCAACRHSCACLPSFLRVPAVIPACLPSFPRRRESGWYGRECESVGYDVSVGMTEGGAY